MQIDMLSTEFGSDYTCAGVAGLKIALHSACNQSNPYKFSYEIRNNRYLDIRWEGSDYEAWNWLIQRTYRLSQGLITLPRGDHPIFTHLGFLGTVLQIPRTRRVGEELVKKTPIDSKKAAFELDAPEEAEITYKTKEVTEFVHQSFANKLFNSGKLRKKITFYNSWFVPGNWGGDGRSDEITAECAIAKRCCVRPWRCRRLAQIALIFSPVTWSFYQVRELNGQTGMALICPIIRKLDQAPNATVQTPDDFTAGSLEDACLHYAISNNCEAHGCLYISEKGKQRRIIDSTEVSPASTNFYRLARECFPNRVLKNEEDWKIQPNHIRCLVMKNVLSGKEWWEDFWENFGKTNNRFKELQSNAEGLRTLMRETMGIENFS